jgi:nucleotide-binding universal stress UspA family protein
MTAPSVSRRHHRSRQLRTQPFRILVASAGESSSIGAIRIATILARRRSASVHALIVAPPFPHTIASILAVAPPVHVDEDNRRSALEQLRRQLATVRGTGDWAMRATTGFAAESITDAATRWPASLVIMGTGEHGVVDRLLGSETALKVATQSSVPVLAVPGDARELPTRAVAAVDFSESSIAAATLAASMVGPNGTLTLLYASPLIADGGAAGSLTDLYTSGAMERLTEVAMTIHGRTKRPVLATVAGGCIVDRLADLVNEGKCDLIALGAHEPTLLDRLLIGRMRARVMRATNCSILVSPLAAEEYR